MHRLFTHLIFLVSLSSLITVEIFSQESKLAKEPETQEQRIINTIPSKVPLKVEIINGGMESALEDIQIKITNSGKKPIYFLELSISSEKDFAYRHGVGFSTFQIGDRRVSNFSRSFSSLTAERAEAKPFEPGDTAIFRLEKKQAEASWKLMMDYDYPENSKLKFYMTLLRFGDGTGYMTPEAVEMPDPQPTSSNSPTEPSMGFFLRR